MRKRHISSRRTASRGSFVERGERRVDVVEFYAIMKALGVDPEAAFSELIAKLPDRLEI